MNTREKLKAVFELYRELVSTENGIIATISPFVLGLLTALLPYWWLHTLVAGLFMGYQTLELWVRLRTGRNGEKVGEMLSDIRQFVAGYVIGILARYIGIAL